MSYVTVSDTCLTISIPIKDMVKLFNESPNNPHSQASETPDYSIIAGTEHMFAQYVARMLDDESPEDENNTRLGRVFESIFEEIAEGYEDFCSYPTHYDY